MMAIAENGHSAFIHSLSNDAAFDQLIGGCQMCDYICQYGCPCCHYGHTDLEHDFDRHYDNEDYLHTVVALRSLHFLPYEFWYTTEMRMLSDDLLLRGENPLAVMTFVCSEGALLLVQSMFEVLVDEVQETTQGYGFTYQV